MREKVAEDTFNLDVDEVLQAFAAPTLTFKGETHEGRWLSAIEQARWAKRFNSFDTDRQEVVIVAEFTNLCGKFLSAMEFPGKEVVEALPFERLTDVVLPFLEEMKAQHRMKKPRWWQKKRRPVTI